jgi:hypothetical protein
MVLVVGHRSGEDVLVVVVVEVWKLVELLPGTVVTVLVEVFVLLVVEATELVVVGAGTVSVVVVLLVVVLLVVGGIVVEELRSSGQNPGAGAFLRLSSVSLFLVSSPPNDAQYRFESVPTVSTMPTCPWNGVGSVTEPLHVALTTFSFTRTSRVLSSHSKGAPNPLERA